MLAISTYLTLFRQNFLEFFDQILIPSALIRVGEFRPKCLIVSYQCLIGNLHLKWNCEACFCFVWLHDILTHNRCNRQSLKIWIGVCNFLWYCMLVCTIEHKHFYSEFLVIHNLIVLNLIKFAKSNMYGNNLFDSLFDHKSGYFLKKSLLITVEQNPEQLPDLLCL